MQRRPVKAKSWKISWSFQIALTHKSLSVLYLKEYLVQVNRTVLGHSFPAALRVPHSRPPVQLSAAVGAGTHNCIFAAEWSAKRNAQNGKRERERMGGSLPPFPCAVASITSWRKCDDLEIGLASSSLFRCDVHPDATALILLYFCTGNL